MSTCLRRREFIALLGSAVAPWTPSALAQQREQMRRIGVLMNLAADDPESSARLSAFVQQLQQLGWIDGRNVQVDIRWGEGNPDLFRRYAIELVARAPDVIEIDMDGQPPLPGIEVNRLHEPRRADAQSCRKQLVGHLAVPPSTGHSVQSR